MGKGPKIKIIVIGCGGAGSSHSHRLLKEPSAELCGLVDTNIEAAKRLSSSLSAELPLYQDYKQAIDELKPEAVVIATPHTLHYEQALYALQNNCHALIEKPMVIETEHAMELVRLSKERNLILMVAYQRRYEGILQAAFKVRQSKERFGELRLITAHVGQNALQNLLNPWRGIPELSGGGQLVDTGSHIVDVFLWLADEEPREVFAYQQNLGAKVDVLTAISVYFEHGGLGNLTISGDSPAGWHEDYLVWGDRGAIFSKMVLDKDRKDIYEEEGGGRKFYYHSKAGDIEPIEPLDINTDRIPNFIRSILGEEEPLAPGDIAIPVAAFSQACYESVKKHAPVEVRY